MYLFKSDKVFLWILKSVSSLTALIVIMIVVFVGLETSPILEIGVSRFITDPVWDPSSGLYNLTPMVLGSLLVTIGALLLSLPLAFLAAVVCELSPVRSIGPYVRFFIEILSGIPSVIFGFWGIVSVVPLLYHLAPPGANLLAGCIVLSAMILPTLTIFLIGVISSSPEEWFLSGEALGLSQACLVFKVLLPGIHPQIKIGILIALGRAIGETMAVLMVCGNIVKVPLSIFDPIRTLTANIALEMAYAMGEHRAALFASGFFLLIVVCGLTLTVHWQQYRMGGDHAGH